MAVALLLIGGGCVRLPGEWDLSFDLPEGWVMTEGCQKDGRPIGCGDNLVDESVQAPELDLDIDPAAQVVYLQNTSKLPLFGGIAPYPTVADSYQSEDVAEIRVERLPAGIVVPPADALSSEDLGAGFLKVTTCDLETVPECQIYGGRPYDYYFIAPSGTSYRFTITRVGVDDDEIEKIVLSALPTR